MARELYERWGSGEKGTGETHYSFGCDPEAMGGVYCKLGKTTSKVAHINTQGSTLENIPA